MRECLEKFLEIKMKEIDEISTNINYAFISRLQALEDELIGDSAPVNSEEDP